MKTTLAISSHPPLLGVALFREKWEELERILPTLIDVLYKKKKYDSDPTSPLTPSFENLFSKWVKKIEE